MRNKKALVTGIACAAMMLVAYFAWVFSFYEYDTNTYTTTVDRLFTLDHLAKLRPLLVIGLLTAVGIVLCVVVRAQLVKRDELHGAFATQHASTRVSTAYRADWASPAA